MVKAIIGYAGMLALIFTSSGAVMWTDVPSLAIVVGVIIFGLLASGKNLLSLGAICKSDATSPELWDASSTLSEAGRLGVASGVIGALIGGVLILMNLEDPAALGPAISMCLLTVLYGTFFKYIIFGPLICRVEDRAMDLPCEDCEKESDDKEVEK